ncbi:MAG: DUF1465 family protein [Sphingomonadales bacterium]|nr:DUF1465 family protein [Sphingomonadales bacterium]
MSQPASINPRIIDALYGEALLLSDAVRAAFDFAHRLEDCAADEDAMRIALSCEGLRTTTRMMHAIAWLLNHRAFLAGELSEFQLRRHGRLPTEAAAADPGRVTLLPAEIRDLIARTESFYARLLRVDRGWRAHQPAIPGAIERLRQRLGEPDRAIGV